MQRSGTPRIVFHIGQQENAVYSITFRLADAVPSHLRNQWESERASWLRLHPEPWSIEIELEYHKRFSRAIERLVRDDAHFANCIRYPRRNPETARFGEPEYLLYESELASTIDNKERRFLNRRFT